MGDILLLEEFLRNYLSPRRQSNLKFVSRGHWTLPTLDKILEPLKDGRWHNLEEINEEVGLPEERLEEIMGFFAKYRFIQLDRKSGRVKLTSSVLEFFAKTK